MKRQSFRGRPRQPFLKWPSGASRSTALEIKVNKRTRIWTVAAAQGAWVFLMRRKADGWNIVLAGLWNRAIFTPQWVNDLLFHESEVETLLSVMPYLPIIYRNKHVAIEVSTPKLVFRPRKLDDATIEMAATMAHGVLNKLQDTPLLAVGVNFGFVEESPRKDLLRLFSFPDDPRLAESVGEVHERSVIRRIRQGDATLNLTMTFDGQAVKIEFNYHTDTTNNDKAREAIQGKVLGLRDASLRLLTETYHLEEEKNDG